MSELEQTIFSSLNDLAGKNPLADFFVRLLVNDYFVLITLSLFLFGFWFAGSSSKVRESYQQRIIGAPISIVLVNVTIVIINTIGLPFSRTRPFHQHPEALETTLALFYPPPDPSFPSNSAAVAFVLVSTTWGLNKKIGFIATILGLGLAFSRIYAGVHYPLDVIAGIALALIANYVTQSFLKKFSLIPKTIIRWTRMIYLA